MVGGTVRKTEPPPYSNYRLKCSTTSHRVRLPEAVPQFGRLSQVAIQRWLGRCDRTEYNFSCTELSCGLPLDYFPEQRLKKRYIRFSVKDRFTWYLAISIGLLYLLALHETTSFPGLGESWDLVLLSLQRLVFIGSIGIAAWHFNNRIGWIIFLAGSPSLIWHAAMHSREEQLFSILLELLLVIGVAMAILHAIANWQNSRVKLVTSEERYRVTAEQTGAIIYDYDVPSGIIAWQGAIEAITGFTPEEFSTVDIDGWKSLVHPEDIEYTIRALEHSRNTCSVFHLEYRLRRKNSSYVYIEESGKFLADDDGIARRMIGSMKDISTRKRAENALSSILEGTAGKTGEDFFNSLVKHLATGTGTDYAFIGEIKGPSGRTINTISFWGNGEFTDNPEYELENTPCSHIAPRQTCYYPDRVQESFPDDEFLRDINARSYMGLPLENQHGEVIGLIAVMGVTPLSDPNLAESLLQVFAARAAGELQRVKIETSLARSNRLLETVADAQTLYIKEKESRTLFHGLISQAVKITDSRFGVIAEVLEDCIGKPYLKIKAVAYHPDDFSHDHIERAENLEFHNLDTILGAVIKNGQPIISNELTDISWLKPEFAGHPKINSYLGIPLTSGEKITGMIALANRPGGYTAQDTAYLTPLLLTTSNILDALTMTEKRHQAEQALQRNLELQNVISRLLSRSLQPGTLPEILDDALNMILSLPWLAADNRGAIFLVEGEPPHLSLVSRQGQTESILEICREVPFGQCLCGQAAKNRQIIFAADDSRAENIQKEAAPHGHYCVPINHGDNTLGVFTIYLQPGHLRDSEEDRFLNSVADTLANIIHSHYLKETDFFHANVLRNVRDSVIVTNKEGMIIYWNQGAQDIFGYSAEEMTGGTSNVLYPKVDMTSFNSKLQAILNGEDFVEEWPANTKSGELIWVNTKISALKDTQGRFDGFIAVAQDITKSKKAEQERQIIQKRLLDAQRIAGLGNWEWDIVNDSLYWSDEIYRIFGLEAQQFQANYKAFIKAVHPDDRKSVDKAVNDAVKLKKPYDIDHRVIHPDGQVRYVHEQAEVIFNEDNQPYSMSGTVQDITQRKAIEKSLNDLQRRNKMILDSAGDGIYGVDTEGRTTFLNPKAAELTGYSPEELIGKVHHDIIHDRRADGSIYPKAECRIHESYVKGVTNFINDEVFWRKDGTSFPVEYTSTPIRNEQKEIAGAVVVFRDITERKQTEMELQRLASFPLYSPIPILEISLAGELAYLNPPTKKAFPDITTNAHDHPIVQAMLSTITYLPSLPDKWVTFDVIIGEQVYEIYVLFNSISQQIRGYVVDITVHKQSLKLESEARAAGLASKAKSDMLASMSHELRTPLNAIIGFSQVLQEEYYGTLNPQQKEYLNDILASGRHLMDLINDVLDLAKVEAGKVELEYSTIGLGELLEHSMVVIREKARVHNLTLELVVPPELANKEIQVDERRIRQVIFNLLSNAAKFTPDGGHISLSAKANERWLTVSVTDTGIGIEREFQKKIFEGFFQVKNQITDKTPGTGLGLSLARSIIELHGGHITVASEGKSKGSTFSFTLPLHKKTKEVK